MSDDSFAVDGAEDLIEKLRAYAAEPDEGADASPRPEVQPDPTWYRCEVCGFVLARYSDVYLPAGLCPSRAGMSSHRHEARWVKVEPPIPPEVQEEAEARARFTKHATRWSGDTAHLSNPRTILAHEDAKAIIAMGDSALPFIFEEMANGHRFDSMMLLHDITGETPFPRDEAGNVGRMAERWLYWWAERNRAGAAAVRGTAEARIAALEASVENYVLARREARLPHGSPESAAQAMTGEAKAFSALCEIADRNGRIEDVRALLAGPPKDGE